MKDLDTVDWKSLKHAYGKAQDVPKLLRGLEADAPETRRQSFDNLSLCLVTEGKVFPASGAAVPFLHELALSPNGRGRAYALRLLAEIAASGTHARLLTGLALDEPATKKAFAKGPSKDCYAAVLAGSEDYARLLQDADPNVRAAAAFLLAFLPGATPIALPALRKQLPIESESNALSSMLLAVGLLARGAEANTSRSLVERVSTQPNAPVLVVGAAHLALRSLGVAPTLAQTEAISQLIPLAYVEQFPWNQGQVDRFAVIALAAGTLEERALAARTLIAAAAERLRAAHPNDTQPGIWVNLAFGLLFERRRDDELVVEEATAQQKQAFAELVSAGLLNVNGAIPSDYGLPTTVADARRWLGIDPAGPLDRVISVEVAGAVKKWPIWKAMLCVLRGKLDLAVVQQAFDRELNSEEILAAYGEMTLNVYRTSLPVSDHPQRVMKAAGAAGEAFAQRFTGQLEKIREARTVRLMPDAVLLALRPLIEGGRELEPRFDALASIAFDARPPARDLILAMPQARREEAFLACWKKMRDLGIGLEVLAPVLALIPSERIAAEILQVLPSITGDRVINNALEVLKTMGPAAVPAIRRRLAEPDPPHRARLEALLTAQS